LKEKRKEKNNQSPSDLAPQNAISSAFYYHLIER